VGVKIKSLRNQAIQYHLFHGRQDREEIYQEHKKMMKEKQNRNKYICDNGLVKK
jgi:hypothetical protein